MSYQYFFNNIDKEKVKTIFELGSRDLNDARILIKHFDDAMCYSFECNPECINLCKRNINNFKEDERKKIVLIEKAVSIVNDKLTFKAIDSSIYKNIGCSSLLQLDFSRRNDNDADYNRGNVQKDVEVDGIRLESYMENNDINSIDLICIDLQGYELEAIKSLGDKLKTVKYIITECSIDSTYINGANFVDLNKYLEEYGFKYNNSNKFKGNFPNLNIKGFSEFDALFINESAL